MENVEPSDEKYDNTTDYRSVTIKEFLGNGTMAFKKDVGGIIVYKNSSWVEEYSDGDES